MQYQEHFGKRFYLDQKAGYWISTTCPKIRAHVWVWNHFNGEVEKGSHIHHMDNNKSNNDISNLQKLLAKEYMRLHMTPERKEKSARWCAFIRPLTKEWHASKEGHSWHKANGISGWEGCQERSVSCEVCATQFSTKVYRQRFCSNTCKSMFRRRIGIDNIVKTCIVCKIVFETNKYSGTVHCGRKCGGGRRKGKVGSACRK